MLVKCFVKILIVFILMDCVYSATDTITAANVSIENETPFPLPKEKTPREKWRETEKLVKQISSSLVKNILPVMLKASESLNISSKCSSSLLKMLAGVKQMKYWAMKMLDSSGKIPNGILSGNIASLGDYDGCLGVTYKKHFQGKYCLVDVNPPLPPRQPFLPVDIRLPDFVNFSSPDSVMEELLKSAQNYYFLSLRTSICVPSTCSQKEVQDMAQKALDEIGLEWSANVPNCDVKEPVVLKTNELVIVSVIGIIVIIVALGTLIDVIITLVTKKDASETDTGFLIGCLLCFSAYTNTKRLLKKDNSPDTIKFFHGMKAITVMWVILNHTYYYVNFRGCGALLTARQLGKEIGFQVIINGFSSVETFFFISAVLIVYARMKSKEKHLNIFLYIFRRIWRLTPPFMFVIAITFLVPHLGSGPVWNETVGAMADKCKANWWTNLLYFNNFIPSAKMCLQWSWYIAADTQLYIIAIAALIPIKNRPRVGFIVIAVLFIIGVVSVVTTTLYFRLYPTGLYVFPHPDDINYFVDHGYFKTHIHLPTYCIGMVAGYIISTNQKLRIPVVLNIFVWFVAITMSLVVVYGVYDWNQGALPSLAVTVMYSSTCKIVWSLSLAWVTITCFTGNGGIINSFLSWQAFVPLSRLTYTAYLVHPVLQHMYMGSTRVPLRTEHRVLGFMFLAHVLAAFLLAYPFSLLFESPFMALEKLVFSSRSRPKKTEKEVKNFEENGTLHPHLPKEGNGVCTLNIRTIDNALH